MVAASSLHLSNRLGINSSVYAREPKCKTGKGQLHFFSSNDLMKDAWTLYVLSRLREPRMPMSSKRDGFLCHAILTPNGGDSISAVESTAHIMKRAFNSAAESSVTLKLAPALCIFVFTVWGLRPLIRLARNVFFKRSDSTWNKSSSYYITASYVQPFLLWTGTMLICRELEPMNISVEASHIIKQRLLHFLRSLSTVMTCAYCLSSLIQQIQKILTDTSDSNDARNMGFQFAGKAVYTAVWVAAVSLFMELLGFSTKKWVTAGGLGTVLLTLAGREILTNFLSSVMIHTTRPFVLNEWIQTKIEGYEVSGTVEHVGWWSPTIIRGDDREAVHIPNHKFTVNIVRNLTQKSHWRIKTHFAISHLDVNKINIIVADMRKVLAKNPQVEQQKLHRRVFLDYVDPENQALHLQKSWFIALLCLSSASLEPGFSSATTSLSLETGILISCFVKTSHFEEYLCVKEAVLLDLMRVISHHGARLATPIRTFHRLYTGANAEEIPVSSAQELNRPFLLMDSSYKASTLNKPKIPTRSEHATEEKESEPAESTTTSDLEVATKSEDAFAVSSPSNPTQSTDAQEMRENHAMKKPALEDNIVLGVALEGSKRTLPIEGTSPPETDAESKEPTACPSGSISGSGSGSPALGVNPGEQREK